MCNVNDGVMNTKTPSKDLGNLLIQKNNVSLIAGSHSLRTSPGQETLRKIEHTLDIDELVLSHLKIGTLRIPVFIMNSYFSTHLFTVVLLYCMMSSQA
jgi:hypothetical protein